MPFDWETAYRDERNKLIDGEHDYAKSYDKYLLSLSGGALALSITFIRHIIGDDPVQCSPLIVIAWISFALSVATALVGIHQSAPLFRAFRDILDRNAEHAGEKFAWTKVREEQTTCRRLVLMDCLNWASLAMFLSGLIFLMSFAALNL